MYRTDVWILGEKARVGCFKRTASKHVYYLGWSRSPAQVGCMRQVLGPRGIRLRGRWEGGSGWGIHVNLWLIHINVWQKPLQYCEVISLQLIKINEKKNNKKQGLGNLWRHLWNLVQWLETFHIWAKRKSLSRDQVNYDNCSTPNVYSVLVTKYHWLMPCPVHQHLHLGPLSHHLSKL